MAQSREERNAHRREQAAAVRSQVNEYRALSTSSGAPHYAKDIREVFDSINRAARDGRDVSVDRFIELMRESSANKATGQHPPNMLLGYQGFAESEFYEYMEILADDDLDWGYYYEATSG